MTEDKKDNDKIQHYNAILIEDLKSEFKFVIEKVIGVESSLNGRMDRLEAKFDTRFNQIETVLMDHSEKLNRNEERWEENERRWEKNEARWEKNEKRWEENEKRWARTEKKIDKIGEKLDTHDREITSLQEAIL